mgnify:CR=1 FL=1
MENTSVINQVGKVDKMAELQQTDVSKQAVAPKQASEVSPHSLSLKTPLKAASVPQLPGLSVDLSTTIGKDGTIVAMEVKLNGHWEGKWIKGLIRQIEREYRMIKNNATRAVIRKSVDERIAAMKVKE